MVFLPEIIEKEGTQCRSFRSSLTRLTGFLFGFSLCSLSRRRFQACHAKHHLHDCGLIYCLRFVGIECCVARHVISLPYHVTSYPRLAGKMAASEVEESEVVKTLSVTLGISSEIIAQLASLGEDAATVLLKAKQVFDEYSSKEEKYRTDMASLRRARVDAGLNFSVISVTNMPETLN